MALINASKEELARKLATVQRARALAREKGEEVVGRLLKTGVGGVTSFLLGYGDGATEPKAGASQEDLDNHWKTAGVSNDLLVAVGAHGSVMLNVWGKYNDLAAAAGDAGLCTFTTKQGLVLGAKARDKKANAPQVSGRRARIPQGLPSRQGARV